MRKKLAVNNACVIILLRKVNVPLQGSGSSSRPSGKPSKWLPGHSQSRHRLWPCPRNGTGSSRCCSRGSSSSTKPATCRWARTWSCSCTGLWTLWRRAGSSPWARRWWLAPRSCKLRSMPWRTPLWSRSGRRILHRSSPRCILRSTTGPGRGTLIVIGWPGDGHRQRAMAPSLIWLMNIWPVLRCPEGRSPFITMGCGHLGFVPIRSNPNALALQNPRSSRCPRTWRVRV